MITGLGSGYGGLPDHEWSVASTPMLGQYPRQCSRTWSWALGTSAHAPPPSGLPANEFVFDGELHRRRRPASAFDALPVSARACNADLGRRHRRTTRLSPPSWPVRHRRTPTRLGQGPNTRLPTGLTGRGTSQSARIDASIRLPRGAQHGQADQHMAHGAWGFCDFARLSDATTRSCATIRPPRRAGARVSLYDQ